MKPYTYLLIVIAFSALLVGACSTKKQIANTSPTTVFDTLAINEPLPYYAPRLNYSIEPYHYQPKPIVVTAQDQYEQAYKDLRDMLEGRTKPDFEHAVFISENPYHNDRFTYVAFQNSITEQLDFIQRMIKAMDKSDTMDFDAYVNEHGRFALKDLRYMPKQKKELYRKALSNWAVFRYITDSVIIISLRDSALSVDRHAPYTYATADPFGMKDWSNSQVINLLMVEGNKGNCFALTALYKILSDRLDAGAKICTAPQHIYIQHQDPKGQYYNVELATAGHPDDGIIQTLTHTPSDAIRSGIALRDYTTKQSIGLCLVNLAKSYEHQFKTKDNGFMLRCADLALKHDSLNLNAILLKAQVLDARVKAYATANKIKTVDALKKDSAIARTVLQLEKHLSRLGALGYRQMPIYMQEMIMNPLQYDPNKWDHKSRNPKPFTSIKVLDPKDEEYWSLTKGIFQEVFEPRDKETYGHFTVNHQTKQLVAMDTTTVKGFIIDPVAFAYDFGARMYDARVGRFVSIDPLAAKYPSFSPYNFVLNSPIFLKDPDGRDVIISYYHFVGNSTKPVMESVMYKDGKLYSADGQREYKGNNTFFLETQQTLNNLKGMDDRVNTVITDLEKDNAAHVIANMDENTDLKGVKREDNFSYNRAGYGKGTFTRFDPKGSMEEGKQDVAKSTREDVLGHELKHAWNKIKIAPSGLTIQEQNNNQFSVPGLLRGEEIDATNFQNIIREIQGNTLRTTYNGKEIPKNILMTPMEYKLQKTKP